MAYYGSTHVDTYYGSTHVDNFEIDCSSGAPYVLWEENCGYDPPQSPLPESENPRIACGSAFGDHGWFSTTNSLTTTLSSPNAAVISWNGTEIWDGLTTGVNKKWFGPDYNTSTNAGTFAVVDQSTIVLNANGGRQYYGKLYKQSGSFVQVGAIGSTGYGWRPGNFCGTSSSSPSDVYVSCVKRASYYHGSPTAGGGGQIFSGQNPSATCGAPYGDGWFSIGNSKTIIVVEGQDVYNGAYITPLNFGSTGQYTEITIGNYRYIRSEEPASSFSIAAGIDINGCASLGYPNGNGGSGRGVLRVPID